MPDTYRPLMGEFHIEENEHIPGWTLFWDPPKTTLAISPLNLFAMSPSAAIASIKQGLLRDFGQMIEMHLAGALIPIYDKEQGWSEYMERGRATQEKIAALVGWDITVDQAGFLNRLGLGPDGHPVPIEVPPYRKG